VRIFARELQVFLRSLGPANAFAASLFRRATLRLKTGSVHLLFPKLLLLGAMTWGGHVLLDKKTIEVFQELELRPISGDLVALRAALCEVDLSRWAYDHEAEERMRAIAGLDTEIIPFSYDGPDFPSAGLVLMDYDGTYRVTNIVPKESGALSMTQYNGLLTDFISSIIEPARISTEFVIDLTSARRPLSDWLPDKAVDSLRRFSMLANKSTGSSHPSDKSRWETFLIAVHKSGRDLPVDILIQWLVDVDSWQDEEADNLAIQYENALSLLRHYDSER